VAALDAKAVAFIVALRAGDGDEAVVVRGEALAAAKGFCTGRSRRRGDGRKSEAEDASAPTPTYYERIDGAAVPSANNEEEDAAAAAAAAPLYAGTKQCTNAQLYTDIMERVLRPEAGIMWIGKEMRRVDALIQDTSNVNHAQQTRLLLRRNVLEAFAGK
jgi:hypothetical protein